MARLFGEKPAAAPAQQNCPPEPVAQNKRVASSLSSVESKAQDRVFEWIAAEVGQRVGTRQRVVCLMDGQRSLWDCVVKFLAFIHVVEILDLMHVLPRLWQAAYVFHPEGSQAAREFVRVRLLSILRGNAGYVIGGLRQMACKHKLRGAKLKSLTTICDYLHNNLSRMRYDEYLSEGYPIASGVIEGACRHVIKDRMERSGMRWSPQGAQAMLGLRSTCINGHWQDFQAYRIAQETQRLYPQAAQVQHIDWPFEEAA